MFEARFQSFEDRGERGAGAERLAALQRACTAGALATLVPGAGDCAPGADAIDAALSASG